MVICNYYVRGQCKYGNNCRFEHPRGTYNNNQNVHKYVSNNYNDDKEKNEFLQIVSTDLNNWINTSHQWKLSCYSPFTTSHSMPEFEDYSMEEIRYMLYNARKTNSILEASREVKNKENNVIRCMQTMISPNADTRQQLLKFFDESKKIIEDNKLKTNQPNSFGFQTNSNISKPSGNLFANIIKSTNTQPPSFNTQMSFQEQTKQPSLFNHAPQTIPSFTNTQMFTQPLVQPQPTVFIQQPSQQLQSLVTTNNGNLFSQLQGANNISNQQQQQSLYYSTQNDLNEEDMNEYNSNEFTLGRIPHVTPTENLIRRY